jgi:hypothetical protein
MTSSILSGEDIEVLKIVTEKKERWYCLQLMVKDGMLKQNSCLCGQRWQENISTRRNNAHSERRFKALVQEGL